MNALLLKDPTEVASRLDSLGLSRESLLEVVERMVTARNNCTANHPPGAPGWMAWSEGTCRLREVGVAHGWVKNEDFRISSICNGRGIRVAVMNADDGTGLEGCIPQNRSRKGSGTDCVVALNQGVFKELMEASQNVVQMPGDSDVVYYYLCVYAEGDIVRAELSCPSYCENGYVTAFRERIILLGGDGDSGVPVRPSVPDDDSEFEITVTRKQAS